MTTGPRVLSVGHDRSCGENLDRSAQGALTVSVTKVLLH